MKRLCHLLFLAGTLFSAPFAAPARSPFDQAHDSPDLTVLARRHPDGFTLHNYWFTLNYHTPTATFDAFAGSNEFLHNCTFPDHPTSARLVSVRSELGHGKAIELRSPNGATERLLLFPKTPFICVQSRLQNNDTRDKTLRRRFPLTAWLGDALPPDSLNVLGCDGLTSANSNRTSYLFLAAADPASRGGIVAGWLTSRSSSGIVRSRVTQRHLVLEPEAEYGALRLAPRQTMEGDIFAIGYFPDTLAGLEAYGDAIARANKVHLPPVPSGYCTWYSSPHGGAADQDHLAELARFAHSHLEPFGFKVVQIDDGWQLKRRDFTTYNPKGPYSKGMKTTALTMRHQGLTAGLWLTPFGWDPTRPEFKAHQDWFVHRSDGSLYAVNWAGTCLDMTDLAARDFLKSVIGRITRQWGFHYIKIDGLWSGMAVKGLYPEPTYRPDNLGGAVFHDRYQNNIQAYRDGLQTVRQAAGGKVFILGCNLAQNMRTLGASLGLVDGMRVGRDVSARWKAILPAVDMASRLYFLNHRVWYNDPDCLLVRSPLTLNQARAWGSFISLSGDLNIVSEWLPGLPPDRLDIVKRTMPNTGLRGRPIDLFAHARPQIWEMAENTYPPKGDVVGLFNWDAHRPCKIKLDLSALSLPRHGQGRYVGFSFWDRKFLPPFQGSLEVELPPASCKVIALRPVSSHPEIVSTSRHVSQGLLDLLSQDWDPVNGILGGTSDLVGDDPYELRVALPRQGKGWKVESAKVSYLDRRAGVTVDLAESDPNVRVLLKTPHHRHVHWEIRFQKR